MAVFRAQQTTGGRKIQAIIRKGGYSLSRTFWRTGQAHDWARRVEDAIASAIPAQPFKRDEWLHNIPDSKEVDDSKPHAGWMLKRALEHYGEHVSPMKKGHEQERKRLAKWQTHRLASKRLDTVTTAELQAHVDERIRAGRSASTVRLEMMLLRAVYRDAASAWGMAGLVNPVAALKLPTPAAHRQRRLEDAHGEEAGEEQRLRDALSMAKGGADMLDLLDLALETGMRQSEILLLTAGQLKRVRGARFIEQLDSKNGLPRRVTLSTVATAIIERRAEGLDPCKTLFSISPNLLWKRWDAVRKKAGVTGFRWHDLRHEALSRMAGKGLNIGELQAQSGHKTPAILLRYVNAKPQDVAKKLG